MDYYVKQLEQQNEELKELLAKEQEKVLKMNILEKLVIPKWEKIFLPVKAGCTDIREGLAYPYGSPLFTYATIYWDEKKIRYYVEWHGHVAPSDKCYYTTLEMAKSNVEMTIKIQLERLGYYD